MSQMNLGEFTRLLRQADEPQRAAALVSHVYAELRAIARRRLAGERHGHTLQTTALVHEAYIRLLGGGRTSWNDRAHFFAAAAQAMRHILLEYARSRGRKKRSGHRRRVPLDVVDLAVEADRDEILAVDEAVSRLEARDADLAKVVHLRYFAGLSVEETAQALGISERTVRRDWNLAKAWLARELKSGEDGGDSDGNGDALSPQG
jgi:RNA polymerase sigma factor (TIGR02999 family)